VKQKEELQSFVEPHCQALHVRRGDEETEIGRGKTMVKDVRIRRKLKHPLNG
jgi:hypothetical protein